MISIVLLQRLAILKFEKAEIKMIVLKHHVTKH